MVKPNNFPRQITHVEEYLHKNPKIAANHRDTVIIPQINQSDDTGCTGQN